MQGDIYRFIICLDYVLRASIDKIKENDFKLTKERSRWYPAKIITDADYADDIALLANAQNHAETLLPIERLGVIWKFDLTDKMKRSFFQAAVVSILLYGCTTWTLIKHMEKSLTATTHGSNTHKAAAVRPPTTRHENYQN